MATNDSTLSIRSASVMLAVFASIGDPEGTRTVSSIVALLVALGLALVMLAVWLHRITRPDPDLLAPLELMGERKWRRADPVWQRRRLDEVRPSGATPMQPSIAPPEIDEAFDQGPAASGFDDLHDVALERAGGHVEPAPDRHELPPPSRRGRVADIETPTEMRRPSIEDLEEHELDPDLLAAAMAELDAELGGE